MFCGSAGAENAVKATHLARAQDAWGPAVARVLDGFYIPTRYANSHADGPPFEHFGSLQSEEALRYAGEIMATSAGADG